MTPKIRIGFGYHVFFFSRAEGPQSKVTVPREMPRETSYEPDRLTGKEITHSKARRQAEIDTSKKRMAKPSSLQGWGVIYIEKSKIINYYEFSAKMPSQKRGVHRHAHAPRRLHAYTHTHPDIQGKTLAPPVEGEHEYRERERKKKERTERDI